MYIITRNSLYAMYDDVTDSVIWTNNKRLATRYTDANSALCIASRYSATVIAL